MGQDIELELSSQQPNQDISTRHPCGTAPEPLLLHFAFKFFKKAEDRNEVLL